MHSEYIGKAKRRFAELKVLIAHNHELIGHTYELKNLYDANFHRKSINIIFQEVITKHEEDNSVLQAQLEAISDSFQAYQKLVALNDEIEDLLHQARMKQVACLQGRKNPVHPALEESQSLIGQAEEIKLRVPFVEEAFVKTKVEI